MTRLALLTDIHFGRKNNSEIHNQDCIDYIDWFCEQTVKNNCDVIVFLGDWHEHRAAINALTLDYSYKAAEKLNSLNLPIYFIVGNHDMYYKNTRDIYTTTIFKQFHNFIIVDNPIIAEFDDTKCLFSPYLIDSEYTNINVNYSSCKLWFGHFEFKGFVVTGDSVILDHGPDPDLFTKPHRIFSGHFHKRQNKNNIYYIGNTFPADYSDSNDNNRGMAIYDIREDALLYINWEDCPMYYNLLLSKLLKSPKKYLNPKNRIKCTVDVDLSFDECNSLKETLTEKYKFRELVLVEPPLEFTVMESDVDVVNESNNEIIKQLLKQIQSNSINTDKLIGIYEKL